MRIVVNGSEHHFDGDVTAADLLKSLNLASERVAVVVNETVVRRASLDQTGLNDGDVVEVITMVGGG